MDPILSLIGDLYSQVTALQQQNGQLAEQFQQTNDALAQVTEARDRALGGLSVLEGVVRAAAGNLTDLMVPTDGDLVDVIDTCNIAGLLQEDRVVLRGALSLT